MRCRKKIFMFSLLAKIFSQRHFKSSRKEIKSRKSGTGIIIFFMVLVLDYSKKARRFSSRNARTGWRWDNFLFTFSIKNMKIEGRSPSDWLTATAKKTSIIIFLSFSYSFPSFHFISIHHYFRSTPSSFSFMFGSWVGSCQPLHPFHVSIFFM